MLSGLIKACDGTVSSLLLQVIKETLPVLLKAKKDGFIKHIGFSGYPLKIYSKLLDKCANTGALGICCATSAVHQTVA